MRRVAWWVVLVLLGGACGVGNGAAVGPTAAPNAGPASPTAPPSAAGPTGEPPAVVVRAGGTELTLDPWTACWGAVCYDGQPPEVLPDIGRAPEVLVEFPVPDWEFTATVQPAEQDCGRRQTHSLAPLGNNIHRLVPLGPADDYDVLLFGSGAGGDVLVSFRWTTPTDGVMPVPTAVASILADHDGALDSYGVELPISNLATTPDDVTGEVTVTASDGAAHTFPLNRQDFDCSEGSIYLTAPTEEGLAAAELGSAPFTYEVRLELDGTTYVGTGVWPDGVDPECAPCVPLSFTPPLPALAAPAVP